MTEPNYYYYSTFWTRTTLIRTFLICALFVSSYLFIYEIDVKSTVALARNIFTPLTDFNRSNRFIPTTNISIDNATSTLTSQKNDTLIPVNVGMISDSNISNSTNQTQGPKEAFVTFTNNDPNYRALLTVLLDSIHTFSTRPIIVFGIDVDVEIDLQRYPRVIQRRIRQYECGPVVYFCKLHAIVSSNVDYGVLLETDDVVNYNVDILFDVLHVWPYPLPISPRHPTDPQNYNSFMKEFNVTKPTTPYIHAHIIWNYRALPFLKHVQSLLRKGHFQRANYDETAVNVMLWKAGANHTLCKYDPYFTFSESYERWPIVTNCTEFCHTAFITLHGSKEYNVSSELLTRLKANVGKPAIQTPGMGGMKHINDTSATCCYPDSKRSPIHPLLCEHE